MATIIKSISFQDFYNYYGSFEYNTYKFKEGINIVNADNNMGKSKFYNGILWLLRDIVYDSDFKRMESASSSYIKMASGKAKCEKTSFLMAVRIIFQTENVEYIVTKSIPFQLIDNNWKTKNEILDVIETQDGKTIPILDISAKEEVIKKIIPTELINYALLQGESMEKLVDLSSRLGLSSTIEALADISNLITICSVSSELTKKSKSLLNSQEKDFSDNKGKVVELIEEKVKIENYVDQSIDKIDEYKRELSEAKNKKEELEALQLNAKKRERFREIQERLNYEIKNLTIKKNDKERNITSNLFLGNTPWLLMGLQEEITRFDEHRQSLNEEKAKQHISKNPTILLPEGSPDVPSLKRMLNKEICEVCGREAMKDSHAWKHIEKIMNRPQKEYNGDKNNFSQFYSNIQTTIGSFYLSIPGIGERINEYRSEIDLIQEEINKKILEYEDAKFEFINAGGGSTHSDKDILYSYSLAEDKEKETKKLIEKTQNQISIWKVRLSQIDIELSSSSKNDIVNDYREFRDTMCAVEMILANTKDRIFDNIIKSLESNANQKYTDLTLGNSTSGGRLSFTKQEDNTVQVSIKDILNGEMTGLGTGFQRMKQLSIVMAIISSKIGNNQFNYPFISDAPFSEFGDNFINNFFKVAPNVFSQSIILIKELYDPQETNLLNSLGKKILSEMIDGKINGTFYVNVMKEAADSTNLVTINKCYKY